MSGGDVEAAASCGAADGVCDTEDRAAAQNPLPVPEDHLSLSEGELPQLHGTAGRQVGPR